MPVVLFLAAGVLGAACASSEKSSARADSTAPGIRPQAKVELGLAAHYAARFAGRRTASGEPYRPEAFTAAHRTLPFGTLVRVTRVDRTGDPVSGPVTVRINDRGPWRAGRVIDLSAAAARRLRMLGGVARVRVEVIKLPASRSDRPSRSERERPAPRSHRDSVLPNTLKWASAPTEL
jgi:rare lipoprotein A